MSIESALKQGYELLKILPTNRLEADLILAHVLKVTRTYLYANASLNMSEHAFAHYQQLCEQRVEGLPLAYLLGYKEFWSLELEVNVHTLIPRPETELLVEVALKELGPGANQCVVDLGVGSGAIAIAIATERPHWKIIATDISLATIKVAARNVSKYNLKNITLIQSDWCLALPLAKYDAIISNPPYIAENDPHLKALMNEPQGALISGPDGLNAIRQIISQAGAYLKEGGLLILEHGYDQSLSVSELLVKAGYSAIKNYSDLGGSDRVITGEWRKK